MKVIFIVMVFCLAVINGQNAPGLCYEIPEIGNCRAFVPTFYFDPAKQICDCLGFGGCNRKQNQFPNLKSCMSTCNVNPDLQYITDSCRQTFKNHLSVSTVFEFPPRNFNNQGSLNNVNQPQQFNPQAPQQFQPQNQAPNQFQPQPQAPQQFQPQPQAPQQFQPQPQAPQQFQPQPQAPQQFQPQPQAPQQFQPQAPQPQNPQQYDDLFGDPSRRDNSQPKKQITTTVYGPNGATGQSTLTIGQPVLLGNLQRNDDD